MLFDALPNYSHLVDVDDSRSCLMMRVIQSDFDEYERRLGKLKESLAGEFSQTVFQLNNGIAALTSQCRLQESAAEEDATRRNVHRRMENEQREAGADSTVPSVSGSGPSSHGTKLAEFWKQKFGELQLELEEAKEKHGAMLRKLEDPRGTPLCRLTKTVSTLNESTVLARMHADKYATLTQLACSTDSRSMGSTSHSSTSVIAEPSTLERDLRARKENGLQRIMQALSAEGTILTRAKELVKGRLRDLNDKEQKLSARLSAATASGPPNALDDVLYLRAELRAAQQEAKHCEDDTALFQPTDVLYESNELSPEVLDQELDQLQSKVREVHVAIIRAEHRTKDASQIVRRAVGTEKVRAQRDRLAHLETEKMKLLQEVNKVSLKAHFDATWLAKAAT